MMLAAQMTVPHYAFANPEGGIVTEFKGRSWTYNVSRIDPLTRVRTDITVETTGEEEIARLKAALEDAFAEHPRVAEVRGRGLLLAIEVVRDRDTLEPYAEADNVSNRIVGAALERGVFFYGGGTGAVRDIVCMGPPFVIDDGHIETMVRVLAESVDAVTGG